MGIAAMFKVASERIEAGESYESVLYDYGWAKVEDLDALKHDIERHIAITASQAEEIVELSAENARLREENSGHVLALRRLHNELHMTRMETGAAQKRLLTENARLREALLSLAIIEDAYCALCDTDWGAKPEHHKPGCLAAPEDE